MDNLKKMGEILSTLLKQNLHLNSKSIKYHSFLIDNCRFYNNQDVMKFLNESTIQYKFVAVYSLKLSLMESFQPIKS